MRDRLLAALLTLAVFGAGFGAGIWAERHRPFPPPPGRFLEEFGGRTAHGPRPPINRAELSDELAKVKPEMDSFRTRVQELNAEFDRDIEPVLTADQRRVYEKRFRDHRGQLPPEVGTGSSTLTDLQIEILLQRPFRSLAFFVVLPMTLERMSNDLKLDDTQRDKVRDLLRVRREKFIELVDSVSPPSLMLSRLAPLANRLGAGPGQQAPAH
ncbi:MAG TPA: hypothetical protein VGG34_09255 [Opitutaceae bacterium]|jgi:Spy/CpxP family protein refolding chaperone